MGQTGNVASASDYWSSGSLRRSLNNSSHFMFTAKKCDAVTSLYYFGAMYYDADYCHLNSMDPLADKYTVCECQKCRQPLIETDSISVLAVGKC